MDSIKSFASRCDEFVQKMESVHSVALRQYANAVKNDQVAKMDRLQAEMKTCAQAAMIAGDAAGAIHGLSANE